MVFPETPLPTVVELFYDSVWNAITSFTRGLPEFIDITRGRSNEAGQVEASRCGLMVNNRDGRFSPRNPLSPLFGKIGRNTPLRVRVDADVRFTGEVPAWPQRWDKTGSDVWVPIEAAGVLRRIGQGASPIGSALQRAIQLGGIASVSTASLVAYWPCEDLAGSKELASALSGADPIVPNPLPDFAASDLFDASSPLPVMNQDNDSEWNVNVPNYVSPVPPSAIVEGQCSFLFHAEGTFSGNQGVLGMATEGPGVGSLHVVLVRDAVDTTAGFFRLDLHDEDGAVIDSSAVTSEFVTNRLLYLNLSYQVGASNITYNLRSLEIGQGSSSGAINLTATHPTGAGMGKIKGLQVNRGGGLTAFGANLTIGHITVQGGQDLVGFASRAEAFNAYVGELALSRIERLSADEEEAFTFTDDPSLTAAMGAQLPKTFLELVREAAIADQGILYEPRAALGLAYLSRFGLYGQAAALELDYTDGVFSSIPEPVDDDQLTRNDITVTRQGGSSARRQQTFGVLSVQPPPDGVGRYDHGVTVNLAGDGQLPNDVSWRLSLGTVDEPRFPSLALHLHHPVFADDAVLTAAAQGLDLGDRVTIANMPDWVSHDLVSQLAQGFTERLSNFLWFIEVNGSPESPYRVAVYTDGVSVDPDAPSRYSSAGTVTTADFDAGVDTALAIGTLIHPLWTTAAANMPFDILVSGVHLRVTAISAPSGDFQTMTVQQTPINGIIKTIPAVSVVALFQPAVYAL